MVAGLLGLSSDDVFRRAERERRRKGRVRNGIIAVLAFLAVAATGSAVYAWQQLKTNEAFLSATLKTATEIVDTAVAQAEKYGVPRAATGALLAKAEMLFDNMALLGRPTPELGRQKAWMLIQFARNYESLGDTAKQKARAEEAHRLMSALVAETPDDPETLATLSATLDEKGVVLVAQGDLAAALKSFQESLAIRDRFAKADPGNAEWQRLLSVSYERVGDTLVAQGNLAEALKSFQAGLATVDRLAKADPGSSLLQRDFSVTHRRIGDVLVAQGDLPAALESYRSQLVIIDRLTQADPGNVTWQSDLGISNGRIGDVLIAQGDLAGALKSYRPTRISSSASPRPTPTMRSGSWFSRTPTTRSATCWSPRAIVQAR